MRFEHEKFFESLQKVPWKPLLCGIGGSFIAASLVSDLLTFPFIPSTKTPPRSGGSKTLPLKVNSLATLDDAGLKTIYDRNIFNRDGTLGDAEDDGGQKKEDTVSESAVAVKSDLPLKVLGLIYGGTPFNGLATIQNTSNQKINSFIVGDALVKEAKLIEIHRRRVILDRNGRREYIELELKEIARTKRGKRRSTPTGTRSSEVAPIAKGPPPSNFSGEGISRKGNATVISESYKNKLLTDEFTKVLRDAKASPHMVDGQIRGFKLTRIREDSIYVKAGFQNEDVVEEINGVPLTNAASAIRLLQSLRNEKEVEVLVNRGGSTMSMNIQVQ